jgi:signal transduction histidine kinase
MLGIITKWMIKITTIKSKLMIAFFSIASLAVIVGIVGVINSLHVNSALNSIASDPLPELLLAYNIQTAVNRISSDIVGFAIVSPMTTQLHQEKLQQIIRDLKSLTSLVDRLGKASDLKEEAESDSALNDLASRYSTVSLQLINSKYNGIDEKSILNLISSADNLRDKIDTIINERIRIENTEIKSENAKASNSIRIQQEEILFSSIGAFLMSLIIGRHISLNSIIKPLTILKQSTIQVAQGNFGFVEQKDTSQADEIGELSIQFDTMRQALNQRTRELEASNKQLSLANEQLKVHDRMQLDFINIAAHELRTPIEPLLLGSEQLKHMLPNEELVSIVLRNAKKLQTLSNTILDAARIEGGTFKLYKERVNIKNIILEVLELIIGSTYNKDDDEDNDDRLKVIYEPKDIFIDADKDRIVQVVSNLVNNAVKFIKSKEENDDQDKEKERRRERRITIVTQKAVQRGGEEDNKLFVSIIDNGEGIDPEIIPRLFSKFVTKSFDGTGLGLYICKNIVEAHGGKIWAENNTNGKGATFSFSLPLPWPI